MVSTKKGPKTQTKSYYDKNLVNDNVNAYYESYYQDMENEIQAGNQATEENSGFKEPMIAKPEKKRKSRFDQTDQPS